GDAGDRGDGPARDERGGRLGVSPGDRARRAPGPTPGPPRWVRSDDGRREDVEQQNGGRQANLLVLGKITSILDSFTLARPSLTLAEIRESTGLPASTVQRLVANLVSVGLLDRDAQGYRIGVR